MTLKELRQQSNKTAQEVASALRIPRSTYSNYEQGIRQIDLQLILPLSRLLEITAEEVIEAQLHSIAEIGRASCRERVSFGV